MQLASRINDGEAGRSGGGGGVPCWWSTPTAPSWVGSAASSFLALPPLPRRSGTACCCGDLKVSLQSSHSPFTPARTSAVGGDSWPDLWLSCAADDASWPSCELLESARDSAQPYSMSVAGRFMTRRRR